MPFLSGMSDGSLNISKFKCHSFSSNNGTRDFYIAVYIPKPLKNEVKIKFGEKKLNQLND